MAGDVGFTGTRSGLTDQQRATLVDMLAQMTGRLHHGDCKGADAEAHWLAFELGVSSRIHPPIDERLRAWCTNHDGPHSEWEMAEPKPFLVRNRDIVDETARLVACPGEMLERWKGGTWWTVRYARSRGKPVVIVWPDGTIGYGQVHGEEG